MIRMLLVGCWMGMRSERRLCEEVPLNLAYRWFCRLGLDGKSMRTDGTFSCADFTLDPDGDRYTLSGLQTR
jgi:transposase